MLLGTHTTVARAAPEELAPVPLVRASCLVGMQYAANPVKDFGDASILHGKFEFPLLQRVHNARIGFALHDGVFVEAAIPYPDKGWFTTGYAGAGYEALAGIRTRRVGFLLGMRAEAAAWIAPGGGFYSFVIPFVLRVESYFYEAHDRPYVLTAWASLFEPFFDVASPGLPSRVMGGRLDVPIGKRWSVFGSIQNTQGTQVIFHSDFNGAGLTAWDTRVGVVIDL